MKLKPGDILEVKTPSGLGYVQYIGRHAKYGEVVRVLVGLYANRPAELANLAARGAYFTAYPVSAGLSRKVVTIAGNEPLSPSQTLPRRWRRAGARDRNGKVKAWLIIDGDHEELRRELTPAQRLLPIAAVWSHEFLVNRLANGWQPEMEA